MSQYLEHCRSTASIIDGSELGDLEYKEEAEGRGYFFDFRRLGGLNVGGTAQDVGIKIPNTHWMHAKTRVIREIAFIAVAVEASPELRTYVPSFINLATVEGSPAMALLTEDATKNGRQDIETVPASDIAEQMLYKPFEHLGPRSSVLDGMACLETVAFDVGGRERLLDFDPVPIQLGMQRKSDALKIALSETEEAIGDLTVVVPRTSRLGEALNAYI